MVRRLSAAAPPTGVQARVYCLSEGRLAQYLRAENISLRVFHSAGRCDPRPLGTMIRAARGDAIDILQAHTSRTHMLARLMSVRLRIPNVTTIHSPIANDENRSAARHPLRAWIERLGRPWTHRIVSVGREEYDRLIRIERVDPKKIGWIPNGVEPIETIDRLQSRRRLAEWMAQEKLDPEAFTVAMVAQMRPRKGPETLLCAMAHWRERTGAAGNLILIGDDEFTSGTGYLDSLKMLARELGIADRVRFAGFMDDPWALAAGADLFALPSLFGEGMPLVLLEAMQYALPIAASDTPGNRELLRDGRNGWLHRPGDHEQLADQIIDAASDRETTAERGRAGREIILADYTLSRVATAYRELYERLLGK